MSSCRSLLLVLALVACRSGGSKVAASEQPWVELFDGASLAGWVESGGPYDGHARWTIEDGALTGRQGLGREGGLIYTDRVYSDFELELEVKIDYPFDSGVFVRMVPDLRGAQLTLDHRPEGEIGAIYADGYLAHNSEGEHLFRRDAWNHLRLVCRGDYEIDAWLNGEPLVAYRMLEPPTGYAERGRIGLQVHGGEDVPLETRVQFKAIHLRDLGAERESLQTLGYL